MREPHSLYLHIPFCRARCSYCAFNIVVGKGGRIAPFVAALKAEIRAVGRSFPGLPLRTVYFGGGTPSLLTPAQIGAILDAIAENFALDIAAEISLEANPDDLSFEWLAATRARGVNRLSLGAQSANARELRLFGRGHDFVQIAAAVSAARRAGFDSLNLDLIYGIPGQLPADWTYTLARMLALAPEHFSLYALGLEPGTALQERVARGSLPAPDDDLAAEQYELAVERLACAGYHQYELSNFSRSGHECRHNLQYWRSLPWLGLGPGAHGYAGGLRYRTVRSLERYIARCETRDTARPFPLTAAIAESRTLMREEEIGDMLMMGLRLTEEGVGRADFLERFGTDLLDARGPQLRRHAALGLVEISQERVRLGSRGRLLANQVLCDLL